MSGVKCTNKHLKELLPRVLGEIGSLHKERPDLIMAAWRDIIGEKLFPMTKVIRFEEGILFIKVNNSTLYSVLSQQERGRLLHLLQKRFPSVEIKNIHFRMG